MIKIKLHELMLKDYTTATSIFQATGISQSLISKIIRQKHCNIKLETIDKLCKFFNCTVADMLEYTPDT